MENCGNWTPESEDRVVVKYDEERTNKVINNFKLEINGRYSYIELGNTLEDLNHLLETQGGEFWVQLEIGRVS